MKMWLSRALFVTVLVTSLVASTAARQAAPARTFNPQDTICRSTRRSRTGTLPNGLTYFVRQNGRPAKRVLLRLAVKTGSLDEADDQQGLAHMLEHMAFNGSAHFKPGELVSYFESTGARLGPHVNASTGFDETIYMLDLPTDKPEVVEKGFTALADFAGGLTLDPKEIDKERGVVIEEWRGGLGAGSRIRDKQIPGPLLPLALRGAPADRQAGDPPDVPAGAAARVLRHLVSARSHGGRRRRRHGSAEAVGRREGRVRTAEGRAAPAAPERKADVPLHKDLLVSVVTDPEVTQSSVTLVRKRPRAGRSARRRLPARSGAAHLRADAERAVRRSLAPARREVSRRRRLRRNTQPGCRDGVDSARTCRTARSRKDCRPSRSKPNARASSASARARWIAPASGWRRSTNGPTPSATRPRAAPSRRNISITSSRESRARASSTSTLGPAAAARHQRRGSVDSRQHAAGGRQPRRARDFAAEGGITRADRGPSARVAALGGVGGRHGMERHDLDARADRAQAGARGGLVDAHGAGRRRDRRALRQRRRRVAAADGFQERPGRVHDVREGRRCRSRRRADFPEASLATTWSACPARPG